MSEQLEPLTPTKGVELYLAQRETEVSRMTWQSHKSRLGKFTDWCAMKGIDNLNELTGRLLHEYRIWRRNEGDLNPTSEKTQMQTLRVFIRWCESIEAVPTDLSTKVQSPTLSGDDNVRDVMLEHERATEISSYLAKYRYASREHVTFVLLWHTMMRRGSTRALDLQDYHPRKQYLEVVHRPDSDTPLKNQERGERMVALSDSVCEVIDDWIAKNRHDVQDEYGREPLLTTRNGRIGASTVAKYVYRVTRPCVYADECPHDRDPASCEAMNEQHACRCPSSVSPHPIRRGSITHSLSEGTPDKVICDRANVSPDVLEKHYDRRDERTKMELRREYVDDY